MTCDAVQDDDASQDVEKLTAAGIMPVNGIPSKELSSVIPSSDK